MELTRVLALAAHAQKTDHERAQRQKESGTNRQRPVKDVLALRHVLFPCFNEYTDADQQQSEDKHYSKKHLVHWRVGVDGVQRSEYDDEHAHLPNGFAQKILGALPIDHADDLATRVPGGPIVLAAN